MRVWPFLCLLTALVVLPACQGEPEKDDLAKVETSQAKLDEPDFSLAAGVHEGAQELEMSVPTGSKVYYSTDGSTPTAKSSLYDGPIQLQPGKYIFKAVAIDDQGHKSAVQSRKFHIKSIVVDEKKEQKEQKDPAKNTAETSYDLVGNIQGLWAAKDQDRIFLFYFEDHSLKTGYLQSEWMGPDRFEVSETTANGGSLYFPDANYRIEIDAGPPNDNMIHLSVYSDAGSTDYGDLLYISSDTSILTSNEGIHDIRRRLGFS